MLCIRSHVCVEMIYVERDLVSDDKKRLANRITNETAEYSPIFVSGRGYYKCAVGGCFRVERIPYENVVIQEQTHACPALQEKISDAPAERILHHGYRCNACYTLKNKARSKRRKDKTHRKRDLAAGPKPLFDRGTERVAARVAGCV